jgi:hypothetical protein
VDDGEVDGGVVDDIDGVVDDVDGGVDGEVMRWMMVKWMRWCGLCEWNGMEYVDGDSEWDVDGSGWWCCG